MGRNMQTVLERGLDLSMLEDKEIVDCIPTCTQITHASLQDTLLSTPNFVRIYLIIFQNIDNNKNLFS